MPLTILMYSGCTSYRLERMLDYRGVGLARFHCMLKFCKHCTLFSQHICTLSTYSDIALVFRLITSWFTVDLQIINDTLFCLVLI